MTIDDVAEIGMQCLVEYENRLKVKGVRPFTHDAQRISHHRRCYLPSIQLAETVKEPVEKLLQELSNVGGFVMSEPECTSVDVGDLRNVPYKDLRITVWYATDPKEGESHLRVICYYYKD